MVGSPSFGIRPSGVAADGPELRHGGVVAVPPSCCAPVEHQAGGRPLFVPDLAGSFPQPLDIDVAGRHSQRHGRLTQPDVDVG
jgi:hypothetical protein